MASRKILDIQYNGWKYKGYKTDSTNSSFSLYEVWWDCGEHRKLVGKFADFHSMMKKVEWLYIGM